MNGLAEVPEDPGSSGVAGDPDRPADPIPVVLTDHERWLEHALGAAIDRAARTSKTAIDVNVTERLLEAQGRVTQAQANRLIAAMEALVHDPRVAVVGDVREVIRDALRELGPVEPAQQLAISR